MGTLSLEQLSYVAEMVGVVAVVISLVYVGSQVKQGTRVVKLSTAHNIAEEWRDTASLIASSEDLADILTKGFANPDSLTGGEPLRFNAYLQNLMKVFENAYYQNAEGALEDQFWSGMKEWFIGVTDTPGARAYWQNLRFLYSKRFQEFMDSEVVSVADRHGYRMPGD